MCRFSIPKKWKSWEVPDVVGFGSFLVTHSETWKLKLHLTLLQSHFESDMIIAWQEWFRCPRHLAQLSRGSRAPGRRFCSFCCLRGGRVRFESKIHIAWKSQIEWGLSSNSSCLKMSNKDVSENVSERVRGSDGRWRNRETAAENARMYKNPLFYFHKPS